MDELQFQYLDSECEKLLKEILAKNESNGEYQRLIMDNEKYL
ncbi:hypothetical protein [Amygdalobacter nucleatus]|uniref:Uncharacterized protein n=1 Tax=Amygdalobacter nucleatus TaxID=3029274 RepID=A0A133Y9K0_9FIRM|nr:hypothetical protein [Amygdalobacter nucleatus]KXB39918.1 hypothetical protein HMPREF1872_01096 [Amygdalobacter nucleatus]MDF0485325.1 hypothetical protein [Amygdalobacter nucleatus]WEG36808.1 hypothetical protein PYS63_06660 [Amygdalobacter nucleatus]